MGGTPAWLAGLQAASLRQLYRYTLQTGGLCPDHTNQVLCPTDKPLQL